VKKYFLLIILEIKANKTVQTKEYSNDGQILKVVSDLQHAYNVKKIDLTNVIGLILFPS